MSVTTPEEIKKTIESFAIFLEPEEYEQIAFFLNTKGLPVDYLAFMYREVKLKNPAHFAPYFRKVLYCKDGIIRFRSQEKAKEVPAVRPPPPKVCPACGRPTIYAGDRAACKPCGLFWEYDAAARTWNIQKLKAG